LSAPPGMPHIDVAVMRSSITIGIVMLLKAHLKSLYGLSEEWVCCIEVHPSC
jgi:cohesin loading factor subunit SCC2